jgi:hypothetical protein
LAYIAMRKRQALDYIEADYGRFAILCLKRFIYFWAGPPRLAQVWWLAQVKNSLFLASSVLMFWGLGRALRRRKPGAWLLFWLILLYPMIYYVVFPGQRYRHPIEPEMTILGVYLLTEAGRKTVPTTPPQTATENVRRSVPRTCEAEAQTAPRIAFSEGREPGYRRPVSAGPGRWASTWNSPQAWSSPSLGFRERRDRLGL